MKYYIIIGSSSQSENESEEFYMKELMIFEGHEVEVLELKGQVLFNPYHVGMCLDLSESAVKMAISKMNSKQAIKLTNFKVKDIDFRRLHNTGENFLTESGVYKLVFKSRKPNAEKFTDWIADEVLPAIRKTGSYEMPKKKQSSEDRTEIMMMNARSRMAQTYMKLAQVDTLSSTYKNVLVSKASEVLAGEPIIPLPAIEQKKAYSAKDIGIMFGISANKVGRIANQHRLKTAPFGEYRRDKSQHSAHECDTWVYFDTVIPEFERILGIEVA
ncbi:toxin Bro [Lacrimispora sp. NSJ-141]|uniref:Toxin Bro n=1 Tax=Lientehia hominis TaxID=2897778 RepID=A0AAP2RKZ9_9FIRM|nr:BRO family protein [Lientehia hominis]MCD2493746.1 toxin Bro [Lientehia hominis]